MRKTRIAAIGTVGIVAALALAGCASSGGGSSSPAATSGAQNGKGKTLTVWAMTGDLSTPTLDAINKEFTKETGAKVNVQTQQWTDISTKITTALASSNPPDIMDIGNTQVGTFGANGGLADLTQYKSELEQGQTWLGGLVDPATIQGKLYGIPSFGGVRAVIYNKAIWSAAGVTAAPTTMAELKTDLDKIKAKNTAADFSSFYLPGQYWYGGMQFVFDAGGDIATEDSSGKWTAGFSSAASQKGLNDWKSFQNAYSSVGSRTLNTDTPDQGQVFADGHAATILGTTGDLANITKDNPKLQPADLGTFPMPGLSGKSQPVFMGGSVWSIPAKSTQQALAREWIKIATSPDIQKTWVAAHDGWIPNSVEASDATANSASLAPDLKAFYLAAKSSWATPTSANWAGLEQPGFTQFFQAVTSGSQTVAAAASAWDAKVDSTLNQ